MRQGTSWLVVKHFVGHPLLGRVGGVDVEDEVAAGFGDRVGQDQREIEADHRGSAIGVAAGSCVGWGIGFSWMRCSLAPMAAAPRAPKAPLSSPAMPATIPRPAALRRLVCAAWLVLLLAQWAALVHAVAHAPRAHAGAVSQGDVDAYGHRADSAACQLIDHLLTGQAAGVPMDAATAAPGGCEPLLPVQLVVAARPLRPAAGEGSPGRLRAPPARIVRFGTTAAGRRALGAHLLVRRACGRNSQTCGRRRLNQRAGRDDFT